MTNIIQFQPYLDRKRKQSVIVSEPIGILAEGEHIIKVSPCDIERMVLQNRIDVLDYIGIEDEEADIRHVCMVAERLNLAVENAP